MSMYSYCMFMYGYPDLGFSVLFPQLHGKCQDKTRKDGARPALFLTFVLFYVLYGTQSVNFGLILRTVTLNVWFHFTFPTTVHFMPATDRYFLSGNFYLIIPQITLTSTVVTA